MGSALGDEQIMGGMENGSSPSTSHPSPSAPVHNQTDSESRIRPPSDFLHHLPSSTSGPLDHGQQATSVDGTATVTSATTAPAKPQVDPHGRTLNPRSCVTCRRRKVKCDKTHPCANCNRAHIECVFPAPGRAPRKVRKIGEGRDKELLERLRRLEGVVKGMGMEVPSGSDGSSKDTPDSQAAESQKAQDAGAGAKSKKTVNKMADNQGTAYEQETKDDFEKKTRWIEEQKQGRFENRFGRLVINEGKSRYINNSFWANLSNEVEDLKGILNQSSDEEDETEDPMMTNHNGFVFGFSSQNVDMLSLHPLPNQIKQYWEIYKDRVDPLVKVLHTPTIEPTVLSAASHLSNLSKGFETLLFAIYYGTTTALTAQDCELKFGEQKQVLLSRYRFALEQSLARANFLTTEELVVLQAFVVFLICLRRNHDARMIWTLTGLVVRIAQTIGIHRDGSHFGLSPFEIEMRRRLWWQVCILDTRASEDHGCDPTIIEQSFDTKMPLNINDIDIDPSMKEYPPERQGCTDMSFCLIRFEVANTFRRINYVPPGPPRVCTEFFSSVTLQDKEKWITECHNKLEERYLKHCDMSVPLFWVTATVARLMMSKMWLMVYHPFQRQDGGKSLPDETKDKLFITSLENIEYSLLLETEARTMKWGWLFRTYMQWHALAFMLSELCHRTNGDLVERAWVAVEKTRDGRWGRPLTDDVRAGHLWRPLRKLYRKAKDARQRGMQAEQTVKQQGLMNGTAPSVDSSAFPARTYSPNANPMFGHPKRPTVTRAPLSNAQLQRFSQGPLYGEMPLDKHELLKSPRLTEDMGGAEVDAMDVQNDLPQQQVEQPKSRSISGGSAGVSMPRTVDQQIYAPIAQSTAAAPVAHGTMNQASQFGQAFTSPPSQTAFNPFPPTTSMPTTMPTSIALTNPPSTTHQLRLNSIDSNPFDLDPSIMDTTGENINWENWDELVRQFGMDVDTTFDRRPGDDDMWGGGAGDGDGNGFEGQQAWGLGPGNDGGGTMGPAAANLRMGMGMGGGDWF